MTSVVIFGGSGYAGSHIAEAAAVEGLDVTSVSRRETAEQIGGVTYLSGSLTESADRTRALTGASVVIVAVSPRGDMAGRVRGAIAELADEAEAAGIRLGVIGGAGSLSALPNGPKLYDTPEFPEALKPEAKEMGGVLEDLRARTGSLDWFYVSPPGNFGAGNAGEYRGEYRVGLDTLLTDDDGVSMISGADFGVAVVEEIENPTHHRTRFTVAY